MRFKKLLSALLVSFVSSVAGANIYDCHMLLSFKTPEEKLHFSLRGDMLHFDRLKITQRFCNNCGNNESKEDVVIRLDANEFRVFDDGRNFTIEVDRFHEIIPNEKGAKIKFSARIMHREPVNAIIEIGHHKFEGTISIDRRGERWLYTLAEEIE